MFRRIHRLREASLCVAALLVALAGPACRSTRAPAPVATAAAATTHRAARAAPRPMPSPVRAVWVARFHYRTPDDVRTIITNCAALKFNTILWQVRGDATVAYPSRIEPWSREFGHTDPGFDPLALAVAEAHRHGMRIEAYVNVMPGWSGSRPPPATLPSQLYHARPDWFLHDGHGRQQPLGDGYVVLNPCLPEVRRHIAAVVAEIVTNYEIDGVHLDYVRYAWDGQERQRHAYPRDARTLALYRHETGRHPDDDPAAWTDWRANQLTRLVREIREAVDRRRPGATLTAAVWRDPQRGYRDYLQNAVAWLRTGLIDAAYPMAYTPEGQRFANEVEAYRRLVTPRRLVPGIGAYQHDRPGQLAAQLAQCACWGADVAIFSYDALYPTHGDRALKPEEHEQRNRLRAQRRAEWQRAVGAY